MCKTNKDWRDDWSTPKISFAEVDKTQDVNMFKPANPVQPFVESFALYCFFRQKDRFIAEYTGKA